MLKAQPWVNRVAICEQCESSVYLYIFINIQESKSSKYALKVLCGFCYRLCNV